MTLFVNALTQLDVSLWCPTRGLVGASWHVDVALDGELGEDGMLFDFGDVKPWIKSRLDNGADHTLLVPTRAPGITISECSEGLCLRAQYPYPLEVRGPRQAFTLFPWSEIGTDRLASFYSRELMRRPPPRVSDIRLTLREEAIEGAAYSYSHGLKRHAGNCQRIAHGHRSRLHIWSDGQRNAQLEAHWSAWLADRYLVDEADVVPNGDNETRGLLTCRYQAPQGRFFLCQPASHCLVMPHPTTIENIAAWLAREVARDSGQRICVQAFEGINKGAFAEAKP